MQITRIQSGYNRVRRRLFSNPGLTRGLVLILFVFLFSVFWFILKKPFSKGLTLISGNPLPQTSGRTNVLILGTGGVGHEGPNLADTIILASVRLSNGDIDLISVPRDLWVPSIRAKINTAYHYGFEKQSTMGGLLLAKSAVSESLGTPIHFALKIDFSAFVKAIDLMGGVDISVDRSFQDSQYPISGKENDTCQGDPEYRCRYETVVFTKGPAHLDGETALKFVRSRHSDNPEEGTDFARSARQEKIITAVMKKLFSISNLKNSTLYQNLFNLGKESLITDITPQYYSTLFQLSLKSQKASISSHSIESILINPPISSKYDYQWVLIPKDLNYQLISASVSAILNTTQ